MGLETGVAIALASVLVSAAGTGAEVYASQQAAGNAKDAQRKQEAAVRQQNAALAEKQTQLDATNAARQARARQAAYISGANGNDSLVATTPLGLSSGNNGTTGGLTKLGQ